MLSFIVIGHNEGWKLTQCFQSIINTIINNNLKEFEIIYVDSNSTDDSIERAKKYKNIKIFKITGKCNAAIGRNVGAKESAGETLFFIDGDMEIIPEFLPLVYHEKSGLKYPFVSGQFENHNYNKERGFINREEYKAPVKDKQYATTGGLFFISRVLWNYVNGMKTKYKRSEDLDIGLRLSKKGYKLLRKKELLANHHTIAYNDSNRMWKMLINGSHMYSVVLLRDHIGNINKLKSYFRENYTSIIFLIMLIISLSVNRLALMFTYVIIIFVRSIINMRKNLFLVPSRITYFILRDLSLWVGLILFWPKEKSDIKYIKITNCINS